jgi:Zn-dependent protease with chaperone function
VDFIGLTGLPGVLIAAAIALVPALVVYVRGRQIARFADDPALPERLFGTHNVSAGLLAGVILLLLVLTGFAAIWAIPLAVIAYVAAGLPLRRILYNETWSTSFYLSFVTRFFVAFWSFWILVSAMPSLALWAGEAAWIVSFVMAAVLMVFASIQAEVIRWLIRARPIADAAVRARFDRLVTAAGLPAPHFEFVDLEGGSIANAFALASLRGSAVVFSRPLIDRLEADEVDAICAHELAHLEYYNPKRLRQRRLVSRLLIVAGALLIPVVQQLNPSLAWWVCVLWPIIVLVSIALMVQDRQKHETASDLRAVALTGNPEALVTALVKIHAIARVPRRWDADLERHMSHPSLKRRIQDIRAAAGTPAAALGDAAVFESADGKARVVFGNEGIEWIEGASASYRLSYDRVGELRIVAARTGETSLLAADRIGHRWQMPLRTEDVPRIQAVLDIVDTRVETIPPAAAIQPLLVRAATFTVLIISVNAGLFAVALVLGMTLMRTEAPVVAAAGLATIAGATLTWRDPSPGFGFIPEDSKAIFAAVLFVAGALLVGLAYARRKDEVAPQAWKLVAIMGGAAALSWLMAISGSSGFDALGFHQAAREWPSIVVLPVAVAGAMLWSARKTLRVASAIAVAASVMAAGVGSQTFLDRFGGDLFLLPATNVTVRTLDKPIREFTLPFGISGLQLSPNGQSIAAVARRRDNRATIHLGRAGEPLTPIDADGVLFVDDDRALVWNSDGSRTTLREVLVSAPEKEGWQLLVEGVSTPAVSLDRNNNQWRLATRAGVNFVETREGVIGTNQIDSQEWKVPEGHGSPFMPIAMSGDRALVLEPRIDLASSMGNPLGTFMFVLASMPRWRSTLWALGPDGASDLGTSRLELQCQPIPVADHGACHIFDASRTRFFTMDAETRDMTAIASLPGRFFVSEEPQGEWMTGWYQSGLVAVRLGPIDAIRVAGPHDSRPHMLVASDRAAAGVWYEIPATSTLRVDPISEGLGTSVVRIYSVN